LGLSSVPWRFCTLLCERWVNDLAYSWRPLPASAADVRKVWEIVNHFPILLIDMLFQAHAEKSQGKARHGHEEARKSGSDEGRHKGTRW